MGSEPKDRANSLKSFALWSARRAIKRQRKADEIFKRFGIPRLSPAKSNRELMARMVLLWILAGIAIVAEYRWIFSN
jgi:hypothetical protein